MLIGKSRLQACLLLSSVKHLKYFLYLGLKRSKVDVPTLLKAHSQESQLHNLSLVYCASFANGILSKAVMKPSVVNIGASP